MMIKRGSFIAELSMSDLKAIKIKNRLLNLWEDILDILLEKIW